MTSSQPPLSGVVDSAAAGSVVSRQLDASLPRISRIVIALGRSAILIRGEALWRDSRAGFMPGRAEAPAPPPPGMAARVFAARAVAEALDLVAPARRATGRRSQPAKGGLDARDRGLARSIATVSLRRLGTIRKALARRLEKGMPKRGGALEWTLVVAAAQILFLDTPDHAAVDLAVKATRADRQAPVRRARQRRACAPSRATARNSGQFRSLGGRYARLARPALARDLWRERARAIARRTARSRRSTSASRATPTVGGALGGIVLPTGSVRLDTHAPIAELEGYADGEWWVQDAAAALPARLSAGSRHADRRSLRRARRKSGRTRCGRGRSLRGRPFRGAAQAACRQFRAPAPSLGGRRRRRAHF